MLCSMSKDRHHKRESFHRRRHTHNVPLKAATTTKNRKRDDLIKRNCLSPLLLSHSTIYLQLWYTAVWWLLFSSYGTNLCNFCAISQRQAQDNEMDFSGRHIHTSACAPTSRPAGMVRWSAIYLSTLSLWRQVRQFYDYVHPRDNKRRSSVRRQQAKGE